MQTRQAMTVAKKQQQLTQDNSLLLKKLPLELRDQTYDDVAASETEIGLHVTLATPEESKPQVHAYSVAGLGHTCKEIRQEFSLRLQCRIKTLLTETYYKPYYRTLFHNGLCHLNAEPTTWTYMSSKARSQLVRVADHRVSKGVHVQDDVAMTTCIPFTGYNDHGLRTSFLTLTVATHPARAYNNRYDLVGHGPYHHKSEKYWKDRGDWTMLTEAIAKFRDVLRATEWAGAECWFAVWWKYDAFNHYHSPDDGGEFGPELREWMGRVGCRAVEG
jgi:hypothetical protein